MIAYTMDMADSTNSSIGCEFRKILSTIEELSGLEASVYSACIDHISPAVEALPLKYRRHMSAFCRAVKNSGDGKGCQGHDSNYTTRRAGQIGHPYVQICRAGVAEVIVPVFHNRDHLATICLGQAITETVDKRGFSAITNELAGTGVDFSALRQGYDMLPHMPEALLLRIGELLHSAIRGLTEQISDEAFCRQVQIQHAPAIRCAIDILRVERRLDITEKDMADEVHLSTAHFSRLFRKVTGKTFTAYITELRMVEAQRLLHHTDASIGDIASRCGFSRQSYFSRRFRQFTGMSPLEYRHQHQTSTH